MYHRDGHIVNSVNDQQIVGRFLGGLENLITLSLSQALAYKRNSTTSYYARGAPSPERASTAFLGEIHGRPQCFSSPSVEVFSKQN